MEWLSPGHLGRADRHRRRALRHPRRLRPRARHPVPLHAEEERDLMMNSVAPFWDGNETWLVLGGGGLLVAFPLAYAVIMPALYLPVIVMLLALIFRGVAFEFRWRRSQQASVEHAFAYGSIARRVLAGRDPRRPHSGHQGAGRRTLPAARSTGRRRSRCSAGVALLVGYALLGATWLVMKTEGALAEHARRWPSMLLLAVLVSWSWSVCGRRSPSRASPSAGSRCRTFFYLSPVPLLTALPALWCWRWLAAGREVAAVRRDDRPVPARLSRARHLDLSLSRAADADLLGRRGGAG